MRLSSASGGRAETIETGSLNSHIATRLGFRYRRSVCCRVARSRTDGAAALRVDKDFLESAICDDARSRAPPLVAEASRQACQLGAKQHGCYHEQRRGQTCESPFNQEERCSAPVASTHGHQNSRRNHAHAQGDSDA